MGLHDRYFLGFDFSTQQVKVIAVDEALNVVIEVHVKYETDLPEFGTHDGGIIKDNTASAPSVMWVKALDMVLEKMREAGFDFSRVAAMSGESQECGTVYWKKGAQKVLNTLNPDKAMHSQLKDCFSVTNSPIWLDTSAVAQLDQFLAATGGPQQLAAITGSIPQTMETGPQILKLTQTQPDAYKNTEDDLFVVGGFSTLLITAAMSAGAKLLVGPPKSNSFAASLFIGDYAPIDFNDGSLTHLLDIRNRRWSSVCLNVCGPDLADKLGEPVPSHTVLGTVCDYLVRRYGFSGDCNVVAFTGDNGSSLACLASKKEEIVLSMGTADILMATIDEPSQSLVGFTEVHPINPELFMGFVGFRNGSLVRQHIMERCAENSWGKFEEMVNASEPGNSGNIGIYFDMEEIQPPVKGIFRFDENNAKVASFTPETEVRAVLESQFLARKMYGQACGIRIGPGSRVIATGGASANKAILQVMADVFNTPVYVTDVCDSAPLGACYRAKQAWQGNDVTFAEVVKNQPEPVCAARPTPGSDKTYGAMMERYKHLENQIATELGAK